jgi:hypothetical protein
MANQLTALPENYQTCREYRHPWEDHNVVERRSEVEQIQVCPRCGNERFRVLSLRKSDYGHIVRRWQIRYTEKGYLLKPKTKVTADDWGEMRMSLLGYTP